MQPPVKPWYRQFWPWFLIALPASTIVGGIITIVIAVQTADPLVVDDYYKEGLAINQDLDRDRRARELGVTAQVHIAPAGDIQVKLDSRMAHAYPALTVRLLHATRAEEDRVLQALIGADQRYHVKTDDLPAGRWHLQIEPPDREWRLTRKLTLSHAARQHFEMGGDYSSTPRS